MAASFSPDRSRVACSFADSSGVVGASLGLDIAPEPLPEDLDALLGSYEVSTEWDPNPDRADGLALPLRVLDCATGDLLASFVAPQGDSPPVAILWAADGRRILTCSPSDGVTVWQARTAAVLHHDEELLGEDLALSPDGSCACVVGRGYWSVIDAANAMVLEEEEAESLISVAWSARGDLAMGAVDGTVHVLTRGRRGQRTLEAHSAPTTAVSFSHDGKLLATKSLDGSVLLWNTADWTLASTLNEPARGQSPRAGMQFAPTTDRLLTLGPAGKVARLWALDRSTIAARREVPATTHYANAKVVLLGDQTVGKTGLGMVLAGDDWEKTDSTHRRNVWLIQSSEHSGAQPERRETYLWDLAGQPGYRLLHQLHLSDVAVAAVVFDARNEVDPLAGVRHWVRALRLAERDSGAVPRLLVSARVDRGGPAISDERLQQALAEYGFALHLRTSAREGWGVAELFDAIISRIDWDRMPKVSSTGLFDSIKAFLVAERDRGRLLATASDLAADYAKTQADEGGRPMELRDEFDTCVGRVAARGLIRRLSFGGMVLLRPEVLDAYAASLVNAVREQPDGMGEISEDAAREGRFAMPADERVSDPQLERLLLTATVEEVLSHEIALREHSDEGPYLVFPTQSRRESDPLAAPDQIFATIAFEGPVSHVYATLVVRVAHSGFFARQATYRSATVFKRASTLLGASISEGDEASGELRLFAEAGADTAAKRLFLDYVTTHVQRRAVEGTARVDLAVRCGSCGLELTREQRALAIQRGRSTLRCMICDTSIDITGIDIDDDANELVIRAMDATADAERELSTAQAALLGKEAVGEFDVFLAHNARDKHAVKRLAWHLRGFGIHPWIDDEQIPPGRWFQDIIQRTIGTIPVAAIVLGPHGVGRRETVELRSFISQCVKRDIPIIPVALPGASVPNEFTFLSDFTWVRFEGTVDDATAIDRLRWGIRDPTDARGRPRTRSARA